MKKTVYVGMSGGVDSSVTAGLLLEQGYDVVGVYMKNWTKDLPGMPCPWKEDFQDAKRVAVQLGIDFKVYDFQKEYHQKVVDYMIDEYKAGRTPNPDIMCNQEVKFRLFLDTALADGADMIATGHYAKISDSELHVADNTDKDQSYFLYRITSEALSKSLMPIGDFKTKAEVRSLAKKLGLVTAEKKDSQGICFVGKVGIREFLEQYVTTEPGAIVDESGREIGQHDGAIFYTLGQRHGLNVGGGLPYYVTGKNMAENSVYVTTDLDNKRLWHKELQLTDIHWINSQPDMSKTYKIRTRYRAPLIEGTLQVAPSGHKKDQNTLAVALSDEVRAVTPGQSAVIYDGNRVVGGGIVA
ncbi:tRNA 2-thiouridine(34) synthase MnmA [Candidatus Saccharibacteria bacterium]|nr:tRNA 2-thiouridine(34) synthase MnmA [Candidatus Saccharibacteria bacterium]